MMRRIRRTNKALDEDIMSAIKVLIDRVGYSNITLTDILHEAKIEPNVFYNRYPDLQAALADFTKLFDFWFIRILIESANEADGMAPFSEIFLNLIDELYENRTLQRILIWELSDDNETTRRTAQQRDDDSRELMEKYISGLYDERHVSNYNMRVSLLIGGIYYLVLHKDRSTFSGFDFTSPETKQLLKDVVIEICESSFRFTRGKAPTNEYVIARRLKENGVSPDIIVKSTGLSLDDVENC